MDVHALPAVTKTHEVRAQDMRMVTQPIPSILTSDLLKKRSKIQHAPVISCPTETLPARQVFHEIQVAIQPLMTHVETREQVEELLRSLNNIRCALFVLYIHC